MNPKILFYHLIVFLIFVGLRSSIAAEISGRVVDADTNSPLYGVNILIEGTQIGTFTDAQGLFEIKNIPEAGFILSAGHIGFQVEKRRLRPPDLEFLQIELQPIILKGEEVTVTATRADLASAPITFSNLTSDQIREDYQAQELPLLVESVPGVFSYSDAGNPQGYSYLKIRGFDQKRISVMINSIPLNDPEDHQVYWVDMPDLAANVEDIQIQRGSGYSPYGPSAFGGSVNIITTPDPQNRRLETYFGYGSFNTRKFSALFNSGIVDNTYQVYGRFSRITSDGYRENSSFEGWSYFLSATRTGVDNALTMNLYGGPELLHAAWDATPEATLDTNRTYNPIQYEHTVDNFNQPHYELHHTYELSDRLTMRNTLFYIKGLGYWQMLKDDRDLYYYGLFDYPDSVESDLVQQKWVLKHQTGWIHRLEYKGDNYELTAGGNFNIFDSHHWDEIVWVGSPPAGNQPDQSSHDYNGDQFEGSLFGHLLYKYSERINLFGDLQFRHLGLKFRQNPAGAFEGAELNGYDLDYNFVNPKAGISYKLNKEYTGYFSAGIANREPCDAEYWNQWEGPDDFQVDPMFGTANPVISNGDTLRIEWSDPGVKPETMLDLELGCRFKTGLAHGSLNLYWMDMRNEIIYGGGVSEGEPIMGNAEQTLHRGIEAEATFGPWKKLEVYGNLSYSRNTFESDDMLGVDATWTPVPIKGNVVPLFPEVISRGRISYNINNLKGCKIKPTVGFSYVGKQYLESTNMPEAVIDPYILMDLGLIAQIAGGENRPDLKLQASVNNLLNVEYETSGYYYDGNCYYPGAERNYFLGLTLGF